MNLYCFAMIYGIKFSPSIKCQGLWDGQNNTGNSNNDFEEQLDDSRQQDRADYTEKRPKKVSSRKPRPKMRRSADDLDLPMDFL